MILNYFKIHEHTCFSNQFPLTQYYLPLSEITISAEQDEEFRMMKQQSTNVVPVANDTSMTNGFVSWMMEGLLNTFTGTKLQQIKINLPGNAKVPITIRCTSTLYFETSIKSTQCSDVISGDFQLGPEYHGDSMEIRGNPCWATDMTRKETLP